MIVKLAEKSLTNTAKLRKFMNKWPGRQSFEKLYPDLHQAIIDLVAVRAGTDLRRQTDDLHVALRKEGHVFSRHALHLHLIPGRPDSEEGKRHVRIVPLKLRKARNTLRNRHADLNSTFAIKRQMHVIVSLF